MHEQLTGLYARPFFEQEMGRLIKAKYNLPIGVILSDIDGFKAFNDTFGHKAGDDLLIATANLLKSSVGGNGILARTGSDGFAVLLLECNRITVESMITRIRDAIAGYNVGHPGLPLSISIGYAVDRSAWCRHWPPGTYSD